MTELGPLNRGRAPADSASERGRAFLGAAWWGCIGSPPEPPCRPRLIAPSAEVFSELRRITPGTPRTDTDARPSRTRGWLPVNAARYPAARRPLLDQLCPSWFSDSNIRCGRASAADGSRFARVPWHAPWRLAHA